jgi:hypothetical protein
MSEAAAPTTIRMSVDGRLLDTGGRAIDGGLGIVGMPRRPKELVAGRASPA